MAHKLISPLGLSAFWRFLKYSQERIRVDSSVSKEMHNYKKYESQLPYEELNVIYNLFRLNLSSKGQYSLFLHSYELSSIA